MVYGMRVILLQDIPRIGRKYDITDVKDGYARNLLIPRGKAEAATPETEKRVQKLREEHEARERRREETLIEILDKAGGESVAITAKANEKGHLFAGVGSEEVAKALQEKTGETVNAGLIKLEAPIKEIGGHEVKIQVGDREESFKLNIERE